MPQPLEGVRVLELGDFLPTAFCCMQLADFGAEVIRVQAPPRAAQGRRAAQAADVPAETRSPFQADARFDPTGRNRRSVVLDLKSPRGREIGRQLAGHCDVVVEGFRPGVMERLGLGHADLRAAHPRLVYCSVSLFGQNGPYRDWPGHDPLGLGVAGLLHLNSDAPQNVPRLIGSPIGDVGAALHATIGILMALRARDATGTGQVVDISMTDASLDYAVLATMQALQGTTVPRLNRPNPVSGVWKTADGKYLCTTNLEPHHWANFCRGIGMPELIPLRYERARRDELFERVRARLLEKTRDEWMAIFHGEHESQAAPVNDIHEAVADPHVRAREMVIDTVDAAGARGRQLGFSIKLGDTPARLRHLAPAPGADTRAVLSALGIDAQQIDALAADGVVGLG
ncbi:MAG: CoA transferase [Burkholderiales bacterium]|nr:CoA transferase [Burkholderiales bacterium]